MSSVIFHIDLNAFYVRCEELKNPAIMNKPVIISQSKSRSVVATSSYEARQYGITSGESIITAIKKCPNAIIVSSPHDYYESVSEEFMQFIRYYTDQVEIASIDECYVDMTQVIKHYERPLDLAVEIQKNLFDSLGLKCSIGIAPNKFLAKMASDLKKPLGISVIRLQEIKSKLWPLAIEQMYGIGKKSSEALHQIGIDTIEDLAQVKDLHHIQPILGSMSQNMINRANGIDNSPLVLYQKHKSFSQSFTFSEDVLDIEMIQGVLEKLCTKLASRLNEHQQAGMTVNLAIRYDDFKTISRSKTLSYSIHSSKELFECVWGLFELHDEGHPKRLLRVGLSQLVNRDKEHQELNLFKE